MVPDEIIKMKNILDSFLGEPKQELNDSYQLEYPCPRCIEKYGNGEIRKFNCSINIKKQLYQCWKCSDEGDTMKGSILKLIKLYGNEQLLNDYKEAIRSLRESKLYKMNFSDEDFNIDTKIIDSDILNLPKSFKPLKRDKFIPKDVANYLKSRRIGWDIIEKFNMGYSMYDKDNFMASNRIYIPSYDKFGDLNYWTGRDYTGLTKSIKYYNPKVERKNIIFNENKIQWDADIVLVEGPFDHIVVPNSIPLLGKVINKEFKLYYEIFEKANANVIIMLDADAYDTVVKTYKELNHGKLHGKIKYIPLEGDLDPSKIYELYGRKGIIEYLKTAKKINEIELF